MANCLDAKSKGPQVVTNLLNGGAARVVQPSRVSALGLQRRSATKIKIQIRPLTHADIGGTPGGACCHNSSKST